MSRRRPAPPGAFERGERRQHVGTYVLAFLFLALTFVGALRVYGLGIGLLIWLPGAGSLAAVWFLYGGSRFRAWLRWLTMRRLEGRHFAFDNIPVRIECTDEGIFVNAADVFAVLDAPLDPAAARRLALRLGEAGFARDPDGQWWFESGALLAWLETRGDKHDPLTRRLRNWLERDTLPPLRRAMPGGADLPR